MRRSFATLAVNPRIGPPSLSTWQNGESWSHNATRTVAPLQVGASRPHIPTCVSDANPLLRLIPAHVLLSQAFGSWIKHHYHPAIEMNDTGGGL